MTPEVRYQADLRKPDFHRDPAQEQAVAHIQRLYEALLDPRNGSNWLLDLLGRRRAQRGLYLWGGPGRGKTYLADSFYDCLPFAEKRRVHFHQFMRGIHKRLGELPRTPNPLVIIAKQLAQEVRVLCLDEFHVHDIADAMLLDGLLKAMFTHGITLVTTSNIAPDELYKDGLQRDRFLHAIKRIKQHVDVVHLDAGKDFRMELLERSGTYFVGTGADGQRWLVDHLQQLAVRPAEREVDLSVNGRAIHSKAVAEDVVWFQFSELCEQPRSAHDYLELAQLFHSVIIEAIPCFGEGDDEAARRFIHLIDALYDHQVKLVATAATEPDELYPEGRLRELFRRTASRLMEMRTCKYLALPHRAAP